MIQKIGWYRNQSLTHMFKANWGIKQNIEKRYNLITNKFTDFLSEDLNKQVNVKDNKLYCDNQEIGYLKKRRTNMTITVYLNDNKNSEVTFKFARRRSRSRLIDLNIYFEGDIHNYMNVILNTLPTLHEYIVDINETYKQYISHTERRIENTPYFNSHIKNSTISAINNPYLFYLYMYINSGSCSFDITKKWVKECNERKGVDYLKRNVSNDMLTLMLKKYRDLLSLGIVEFIEQNKNYV